MGNLNWSRFQELSGAETENFEKLCRGVVKRHFAGSGVWHELKNQPGVEFFIELFADHPRLGRNGEKVGWQCKWFQYRANGCLTASAKDQITKSLDKTKEHVAHLDHWILWTHVTLSRGDQDWFQGLKENYNFQLHIWNQNDLNELLNGPALDLRNSYFGELALTNEMLDHQHQLSIAPVKDRCLQQVHQITVVEKEIRKILGEKDQWDEFRELRNDLTKSAKSIDESLQEPVYEAYKDDLSDLIDICNDFVERSQLFENDLTANNIEQISFDKKSLARSEKLKFYKLLVRLRSKNLPLSLIVTNTIKYIEELTIGFLEAKELCSQQLIAVIADAGDGKTQLSIEMSASSEARPSGIYILGKHLSKGGTLDDLAQRIKFYNKNIENFESLLSAVNSVAERANCRLPIFIDGLNESEDIREWKDLLAPLSTQLKDYPNVVLVCTSRNPDNILNNIFPQDTHEINLKGFDQQFTKQVIKDYFLLYKIKADENSIPFAFFKHPLTLKIFCEVTNRDARDYVNVASFPSSIYSLFSAQMEYVAKTIESNTNLEYSYTENEIYKFLYHFGELLYEQSTRFVNERELFSKIQLPTVAWSSNIINLLVQEGVILRECNEIYEYSILPVYDRLGGVLIANFLLRKNSNETPSEWASSQHLTDDLFGNSDVVHPLAEDILFSLVALMPKQTDNKHFYDFLPEAYKEKALRLTPYIEESFLNREIVESYKGLLIGKEIIKFDLDHLLRFKLIESHPLNVLFLDDVLTAMHVSNRDLLWTELVREESAFVIGFLQEEIKNIKKESWEEKNNLNLLLIHVSWFLTSTVIELRDRATELLFNMGLKNPGLLLETTIKKLSVNDPYISERLLAASYAVACIYVKESSKKDIVIDYGKRLYHYVFSDNAEYYTTHILSRDYASNTIKVVLHYCSSLSSIVDKRRIQHPYQAHSSSSWGRSAKRKFEHPNHSPFRMDFENYTIGRLIKNRANYDYANKDYIEVRENILWRIEELGWSQKEFKVIDSKIENATNNYSRSSRPLAERYGKKYSWIAYYEMAGKLSDEDKLDGVYENRFDVDIDPFFPNNMKEDKKAKSEFISNISIETNDWIDNKGTPDIFRYLSIDEDGEEWVLLYGKISENCKKLNRHFECIVDTGVFSARDAKNILEYISNDKKINWPNLPQYNYVYIGEYYIQSIFKEFPGDSLIVDVDYETKINNVSIFLCDSIITPLSSNFKSPVTETYNLSPMVISHYWEANNNIDRCLLAPWVVNDLKLKFDPTTCAYYDSKDDFCVKYKASKGKEFGNYTRFLYLRRDLFENLMSKDSTALQRISGERRLAKVNHQNDSVSYKEFECISQF